jgi:hypothetical protein
MIEFRCRHRKTTRSKSLIKIEFFTLDHVTDEQLAEINEMPGYLMFQEDRFSHEQREIMKNKKFGLDEKGMSPSQKMRGVILDVWLKIGSTVDQETFYKDCMSVMTNSLKKKYGV